MQIYRISVPHGNITWNTNGSLPPAARTRNEKPKRDLQIQKETLLISVVENKLRALFTKTEEAITINVFKVEL